MIDFGMKKIQKVQYSHLVCLPSAWVRTMGIHKGDGVKITTGKNNELIITPAAVRQDQPAEGSQTA
jgi:antitoxin component of MazEF toxin-antitoxin module